jgi:DNA-binding NtrC family response regulator
MIFKEGIVALRSVCVCEERTTVDQAGRVLLVCQNEYLFDGLSRVLEPLGLDVTRASSCVELRSRLRKTPDFLAVFVETALPDGTWRDAQTIVSHAAGRLPVIAVSPFVDLTEYLDTMESGVADYVVPPFLATDIAHVLMAAVGKTQTRAGSKPHSREIAGPMC